MSNQRQILQGLLSELIVLPTRSQQKFSLEAQVLRSNFTDLEMIVEDKLDSRIQN